MALTSGDLTAIKDLMKVTIHEEVPGLIDERIGHLPTKDEFYEEMSEVRKDLEGIHEELTILNHRVSNHSDRIEKIEKKLQVTPAL